MKTRTSCSCSAIAAANPTYFRSSSPVMRSTGIDNAASAGQSDDCAPAPMPRRLFAIPFGLFPSRCARCASRIAAGSRAWERKRFPFPDEDGDAVALDPLGQRRIALHTRRAFGRVGDTW
jgi:hypothetical protein